MAAHTALGASQTGGSSCWRASARLPGAARAASGSRGLVLGRTLLRMCRCFSRDLPLTGPPSGRHLGPVCLGTTAVSPRSPSARSLFPLGGEGDLIFLARTLRAEPRKDSERSRPRRERSAARAAGLAGRMTAGGPARPEEEEAGSGGEGESETIRAARAATPEGGAPPRRDNTDGPGSAPPLHHPSTRTWLVPQSTGHGQCPTQSLRAMHIRALI